MTFCTLLSGRDFKVYFACVQNTQKDMLPSLPLLGQLASQPFKRSQTGLFHGKLIQFGNNVPFSKKKTRRTWLPNIQQKGLRSEVLNREFTLKVTTKALKTIKKVCICSNLIRGFRMPCCGDALLTLNYYLCLRITSPSYTTINSIVHTI